MVKDTATCIHQGITDFFLHLLLLKMFGLLLHKTHTYKYVCFDLRSDLPTTLLALQNLQHTSKKKNYATLLNSLKQCGVRAVPGSEKNFLKSIVATPRKKIFERK